MQADRNVFHYLLANRKDIRRSVKQLDDGNPRAAPSPSGPRWRRRSRSTPRPCTDG